VLAEISKRAAGFKSLKDSWADTTSARGQLMLTILGGLAEFERELIRARTGEGRKRAKARGVRFGRPRKMTSHQRQEALRRLHAGETMPEVARTYAVDGSFRAWQHPALSGKARPTCEARARKALKTKWPSGRRSPGAAPSFAVSGLQSCAVSFRRFTSFLFALRAEPRGDARREGAVGHRMAAPWTPWPGP